MKKSRTIILYICALFGATNVFAQSNTVASGGQANGVAGDVSYTVGQVNYISASGSGGLITAGLQQPIEIFATDINELPISFSALLFPNPTNDFLVLQIKSSTNKKIKYHLFDLKGGLICQDNINDSQINIPVEGLAPQTYFLRVSNAKESKTFKIIKSK